MPAGKAGRATLGGETALDGRLPVNPSGGLKARGHPLAATGISQIVELCLQLRGMAEGRQVAARVGLAHSIGGLPPHNLGALVQARGWSSSPSEPPAAPPARAMSCPARRNSPAT